MAAAATKPETHVLVLDGTEAPSLWAIFRPVAEDRVQYTLKCGRATKHVETVPAARARWSYRALLRSGYRPW